MTPGETLGNLYNIHVGSNKTKQQVQEVVSLADSSTQAEASSIPKHMSFTFPVSPAHSFVPGPPVINIHPRCLSAM